MTVRRSRVALLGMGVVALALAGCGTPTTTVASSTAPRPVSSVSARSTSSAAPTPSASSTASVSSTAHPGCSPAVTITFQPVASTYRSAPVRTMTARVTARCDTVLGVAALHAAITADSDAELAGWRTALPNDLPGPATGSYTRKDSVLVNTDGLVVVQGASYLYAGGAHGTDERTYEVLDTTHGVVVTHDAIVAELQRHGLTHQRLDAIIDAAAAAALKARTGDRTDASGIAPLTAAGVDLWPGRSGLHGSVDHCSYYACAVGVVDFTIPWSSLVPAGADLTFLPSRWGH